MSRFTSLFSLVLGFLIVTTSAASASPPLYSSNLLLDPSFESGSLQAPFTGAANAILTLDTSERLTGNASLRMKATADDGFTTPWRLSSQAALTAVNGTETFIFSGWVKSEPAGKLVSMFILCYDETYQHDTYPFLVETFYTGSEWEKVSVEHTCAAGTRAAGVRLDVDENGTTAWWDDLRFARKDGPGSNLLPNPGFESGSLRAPFETSYNGSLVVDNTTALTGAHSLRQSSDIGVTETLSRPWRLSSSAAVVPIPSTGANLTFSAWVKGAVTGTPVDIYLLCLDGNYDVGTYTNASTSGTTTTDWQQLTVQNTCAAGASYASVRLDIKQGDATVYWDDLRLHDDSGRFNMITDPGMEKATLRAPYAVGVSAVMGIESTEVLTGSSALWLTANTNTAYTSPWRQTTDSAIVPLDGEGDMHASVWAKTDTGTTNAALRIFCLDEDYNYETYPSAQQPTTVGTAWQQIELSHTCQDGSRFASVRLDVNESGKTVWWDDLHLSDANIDKPEKIDGGPGSGGDDIVHRNLDFEGARGLITNNAFFSDTDIDNINTLNGNLVVSIPIGQRFGIGPNFNYGLTLTYNSSAWDVVTDANDYHVTSTFAVPRYGTNAGLGWSLSLGALYRNAPGITDPANWPNRSEADWLYVSPDGSNIFFERKNGSYYYGADGNHIRLHEVDSNTVTLEFRNGEKHTFNRNNSANTCSMAGSCWRPKRMEDTFGNYVNIAYFDVEGQVSWTLTDIDGRQLVVEFEDGLSNAQGGTQQEYDLETIVDRVILPSFDNGPPAVWDFQYQNATIDPMCPIPQGINRSISLPFLEVISMPAAGYEYEMDYNRPTAQGTGRCNRIAGLLTSITLPSHARIEYSYSTSYLLPTTCNTTGENSDLERVFSTGVGTRTVYENASASNFLTRQVFLQDLAERTEPHTTSGSSCNRSNLSVTDVVHYPDLLGEYLVERHYHTVTRTERNTPASGTWTNEDYGLPISKVDADAVLDEFGNKVYLSKEIAGCSSPAFCSDVQRREYLRYAIKKLSCNEILDDPSCFRDEALVATKRRTFPGGKYIDTYYTDYNGLGRFRSMQTRSNMAGSGTRTEYTDYDTVATSLSVSGDGVISGALPKLVGGNYLLDLYGFTTDSLDNKTVRNEFLFDSSTGFLQCQRRLKNTSGSTRLSQDLGKRYTPNGRGFVALEEYAGGDRHSNSTAGICPTSAEYTKEHEYSHGQRRSTRYLNGAQGIGPLELDLTIDLNTGFPKFSRDNSIAPALSIEYDYDLLGRRTSAKARSVGGSFDRWSASISYDLKSPGEGGGKIGFYRTVYPSAVSENLEFHFDGVGREDRIRANTEEGWIRQQKFYFRQGYLNGITTFQRDDSFNAGVDHRRRYHYDLYGRVIEVEEPKDESSAGGGELTEIFRWDGTWDRRNVRRYHGSQQSTTREFIDAYNRVYETHEGVDGSGSSQPMRTVLTTWNGDLVQQRMRDANGSQTQYRKEWIDGRGLKYQESMPEKNGLVFYEYDSMGQLVENTDNGSTVTYNYDKAARLTSVWNGNKVLKEFQYTSQGRVDKAHRYNYFDVNNSFGYSSFFDNTTGDISVKVTEDFSYDQVGMVNSKETIVELSTSGGTTELRRAIQSWQYDGLGRLVESTYPTCITGCSTAAPAKKIKTTYQFGQLDELRDTTSGEVLLVDHDYHPNGLPKRIGYFRNGLLEGEDLIATGYNQMDRVKEVKYQPAAGSATSLGINYYDRGGNLDYSLVAGGTIDYSYDRLERLDLFQRNVTTNPVVVDYDYDIFGNALISETGSVLSIDDNTNRLLSIDGQPVTYDARGNMLSTGCINVSYDALDMQQAWACYNGSTLPTVPGADFFYQSLNIYNASDQRVFTVDRAKDPTDPVSEDFSTLLFLLRDQQGSLQREFREDEGAVGVTQYKDYIRAGRQLRAIDNNGLLRFAHLDRLGTPRLFSTGTGVTEEIYLPFGSKLANVHGERIGFTGHELNRNALDANHNRDGSGTTYNMGAREYAPVAGRFLSVDPARDGWSRYTYARNNPVRFMDPDGAKSSSDLFNDTVMYVTNIVGPRALKTLSYARQQAAIALEVTSVYVDEVALSSRNRWRMIERSIAISDKATWLRIGAGTARVSARALGIVGFLATGADLLITHIGNEQLEQTREITSVNMLNKNDGNQEQDQRNDSGEDDDDGDGKDDQEDWDERSCFPPICYRTVPYIY